MNVEELAPLTINKQDQGSKGAVIVKYHHSDAATAAKISPSLLKWLCAVYVTIIILCIYQSYNFILNNNHTIDSNSILRSILDCFLTSLVRKNYFIIIG